MLCRAVSDLIAAVFVHFGVDNIFLETKIYTIASDTLMKHTYKISSIFDKIFSLQGLSDRQNDKNSGVYDCDTLCAAFLTLDLEWSPRNPRIIYYFRNYLCCQHLEGRVTFLLIYLYQCKCV